MADWVPGMIEGENVLTGTGTAVYDGVSTITTTGNPIIEYSRFNVDAGVTIDFAQPSTTSAVLNRIIVANPSLINGTLTSNGQVYIVNPAGVIFGKGSTVSVSQLVVSGLGMTDTAFTNALAGGDLHFTGGSGTVKNEGGTLNATDSIILVGKKILNQLKLTDLSR
jgi:filamentous hemagglutinin family protein